VHRIAVLGCGGSGKTTLARELGRLLELPVVHVDMLQRSSGALLPEEVWWRLHDEAVGQERWVIDAMKPGLLDRRLAAADTAILLDLPRRTCLLGILQRRLRYRGRIVPDEGVVDRLDVAFLRWVWRFRRTTRPLVLDLLARHAGTTDVLVLSSRREVRAYVASLATVSGDGSAPR